MAPPLRQIDPDTIIYPEGSTSQLKLSVSPVLERHASVKVPLRAYVEYFDLAEVIESVEINDENSLFGLYAHQLTVSGASGTVGLSLPGANGAVAKTGTDDDKKKKASGSKGGTLELYVEELPLTTAQRLSLKAVGGQGASALQGASKFGANGDGGDGGSVKVIYGCVPVYGSDSDVEKTLREAIKIFEHIQSNTASAWPEDFRSDIANILKMVQSETVKTRLPEVAMSLNSIEAIAGYGRNKIENLVSKVISVLTRVDWFSEADELLSHLDNKTWPQDYGQDADDFLHIVDSPTVSRERSKIIDSKITTRSGVLGLKKEDFATALTNLISILKHADAGTVDPLIKKANKILVDINGRKWSEDYREDAEVLFRMLNSPELKHMRKDITTATVNTPQDLLNHTLRWYGTLVRNVVEILQGMPSAVGEAIQKATDVSGGNPGSSDEAGQVQHGKMGTCDRQWIGSLDRKSMNVCFAHPYQCQMLLDQANFLFSEGSADSIVQSLSIVKRLQRRLEPFAEPFVPDSTQKSEPELWNAYRVHASDLYIVEKKTASILYEEPYAIQQFRAIRTEAATIEQQIYSGKDFYGKDPNEVPRCSFKFYSDYMVKVLEQLKDLEDTLTTYLNSDANAAKALVNTWEKRQKICTDIKIGEQLYKEAQANVEELGPKIKSATALIQGAKNGVLVALQSAEEAVKNAFGVSAEDIINGLSQVIFSASMSPYAGGSVLGLEAGRLWYQGVNKIRTDDTGTPVDKSYLIEQIQDVEGGEDGKQGIKNINEGYRVISNDGRLELADPGGKKLLMIESDLQKALSSFRSVLGDNYKKALAAFDYFQEIIEHRNQDVLNYNSAVVLLFKYSQKQDQLKQSLKQVNNEEYDKLDALHPAIRAWLQKRYKDDVRSTLFWLNNMQQAYRFQGLVKNYNKIGDRLADPATSFPNHSMLLDIKNNLDNDNNILVDRIGQPNQVKKNVPFHLDKEALDDMKQVFAHDWRKDINVTAAGMPKETYDVRLDVVRFYAVGAKTKNTDGEVVVKLIHPGPETFVKKDNSSVTFAHQPIPVLFSYKTNKCGQYEITSDGLIGLDDKHDNPWARVGPLTNWRVEITPDLNEGLDLSKVTSAYLEFDILFRAQLYD